MPDHNYWDTFLGADIGLVDPDTNTIIGYEEERQARKLIMIPSESIAPLAVRQALGSVFNNVYAEGYPPLRMTRDDEETILDTGHQLVYYRRYADRRFYKGVDYVNFIETLAQRRAALIFANERVADKDIYVNVQPLSGAAANLAVYDTLVNAGDTVMGMDLYQGGHLTHGSEFNFSGKRYHVISYGVSRSTGKLDYDEIRDLARRNRPKMIIGGFTSYTWAPDWALFRSIADEVGALLLADISHAAGMATAGAYPNPIGIADVITCTTHKTLCGPARRHYHDGRRGSGSPHRPGGLPRRAGRAAHAEVRRDGRGVQNRSQRAIQTHDVADQGKRGGVGRRADAARPQAGLRRHRHTLLHAGPEQRQTA